MHVCLLAIFAVLLLCSAVSAAVVPAGSSSMAIRVEAGDYIVRGKTVTIALEAQMPVAEREKIVVKNEEHVLSDGPVNAWAGGTSLAKVLGPVDTMTRLPDILNARSVSIHSADTGGTVYEEGKDYQLDHVWGGISRIDKGSIIKGSKVYVDYEVFLQRIDTVQVSKAGAVHIKKGKSAAVCPSAPEPDPGCTAVAGVYISSTTSAITSDSILPLPQKDITWRSFIKSSGKQHLQNTLNLLNAGKPVTVVCWGDSVTEGASPSSHDKCYVESFRARLKAAYPQSNITLINAGIGGSNTESRRAGYEKEVLSYNPDLITVEFVNDAGLGADKVKANWAEFMTRARAQNPKVEFILITPHNVMPMWMSDNFIKAVNAMRAAAVGNAALADANNIWINLGKVGVPYYALLANGINHPNDLGHEFFVSCMMDLLSPAE